MDSIRNRGVAAVSTDSAPDDPLLARVLQGDIEALAEYITQRRRALLIHIENRLGAALRSKIEPDDILQEVSVGAMKSLAAVDLAGQDPWAWLCQIAEHRIVDAHRRFFGSQKRDAGKEVALGGPVDNTSGGLINMIVASITSPSQAFSRDQKQLRLAHAMDQLPEQGREALRLRYVEGLPTKEIAEQLGKSDGAIRVLLSRSVAQLRSVLEESE
jgi:RNA polymerase sigma-70 factor (subfamily 1)